MPNFSAIATEIYDTLRAFDYILDLYDEDGNTVYEPEDARRFYASRTKDSDKVENIMVAIVDDNDNSTVKFVIGPDTDTNEVMGLKETLESQVTKYNMIFDFDVRDKPIRVKDFATKASIREGKKPMKLNEVKFTHVTSRSAYVKMENARMIVRHGQRVDETKPGERTRKVSKVFVENAEGERYLMPVTNVQAGLAMTQHVNQGGSWADPIAAKIEDMASHFGDLGAAVNYLGTNDAVLAESCGDMREKCAKRRKSIRECFRRMAKESSYAKERDRLEKLDEAPLLEDAELERLRESLTVEGKMLPERVLNACARVVAEGDCHDEVLDEDAVQQAEPEADETETNVEVVMGRAVDKDAWELLKKHDKLELSRSPDLTDLPHFKSTLAQIMYKMNEIAKVVRDDSLANLFSQVYDDYVHGKFNTNADGRRKATLLGINVCKAAGVQIQTEGYLGPRGVSAILEMEEWFRGFSTHAVLVETGVNPTQVMDILDIEEGEPDEPEEGELPLDETEELTQEDVLLPKDDYGDEDSLSDVDIDMRDESEDGPYPGVELETGDDDEDDEDDDLPRFNQGFDLAGEVLAQPDSKAELDRILQLANIPSALPASGPIYPVMEEKKK